MNSKDLKKVTVIGAGEMGHSIAQVFASCGLEVALAARKQSSLEMAETRIKENLTTLVIAGKISEDEAGPVMERITYHTDLAEALTGAGFVLEAIPERAELKTALYKQLDTLCGQDIIIASTTSGLNIFELADISNKSRLVIHHWFAPAYIIPLVEIVPGPETAGQVIDFSVDFIKKLNKKPIVMNSFVPSFIVNRIQNAIAAEALKMVSCGWATPGQIDEAVKTSLGVRLPIVGVLQSLDFNGIDTVYDILKGFGEDKIPPLIKELYIKGDLGAKSARGIYDYGSRTPEQIVRERDLKYLDMLSTLEKLTGFEPI